MILDELKQYHPPDVARVLYEIWEDYQSVPESQQKQEDGWDAIRTAFKGEREFINTFFWIKTKDPGRLTLLRYNLAQRVVDDEWTRQETAGRPVRIYVLKARQQGISTYTQGRFCYRVLTQPHVRATVLAHIDRSAQEIFEMTLRIVDHLPFRPPFKRGRLDEIITRAGSKYDVMTAGSKNASRGINAHLVHLSEFAYYDDPETVMGALMHTIGAKPGTAIIIETTANGMANLGYKLWKDSMEGKNDFVPVFLPWWRHQEYRLPLRTQKEVNDVRDTLDSIERQLIAKYKLSLEQIAWYRWCLRTPCLNDPHLRAQEYPSSWQEAFLHSGTPVFNLAHIEALMATTETPQRGNLVWD